MSVANRGSILLKGDLDDAFFQRISLKTQGCKKVELKCKGDDNHVSAQIKLERFYVEYSNIYDANLCSFAQNSVMTASRFLKL